jgi:adenylate cyclase
VEFDEEDVAVMKGLKAILEQGFGEEDVIQVARTYGYGMSRVAQAEVRLFSKNFIEPLRAGGMSDEQVTEKLQRMVPRLLEQLNEQVAHVHRRHLAIALQQVTSTDTGGSTETLAAGFVDLVGFSRIARDLEGDDLGELVSRFETLALERSVEKGVHVVKMIGDAVMFVSPDPEAAVGAAVAVVNAVAEDSGLPEARAGVDIGDAVSVGGDFFGRPVNIAARLTGFARPGTVVASEALIEALPQPADTSRIGRQRFKGVGQVRAFKVNRYPGEEKPADPPAAS